MTDTPTWVVVPSEGRDSLRDCLVSLRGQVDGIVIVANGGYRPGGDLWKWAGDVPLIVDEDASPDRNISRWWNLGIDRVAYEIKPLTVWNVLVINDDVVVPSGTVATLASRMRSYRASMAYPNQADGNEVLWTRATQINLHHRITGYCFMLAGEQGLRADESLVWWFGDDDLDWRAREMNGALLVPGCAVEHSSPNGYTQANMDLQVQAGRDRVTFAAKWGKTPW